MIEAAGAIGFGKPAYEIEVRRCDRGEDARRALTRDAPLLLSSLDLGQERHDLRSESYRMGLHMVARRDHDGPPDEHWSLECQATRWRVDALETLACVIWVA